MSVIGKNHGVAPAFLALSCVSASLCPAFAQTNMAPLDAAAAVADPEQPLRNDIVVTGATYEDVAINPKATQPILDTPQTITIISDQVIRKQNLLTLRDVLATVPGITFGAGEGGGGYGDSINLRGYSANNDITQDGVRDSAQYSRTDPFNTQQIEVYNGANSVYNGSGSVGGTINLVSKLPQADDLTIIEGGIGTDDYYRATVDSNVRVSDLAAVRLNAMYHRNDVPGRDVERYERWAVAPSITLGVGGPTSLTLSYLHQEDKNTPIFGVPFVKNEINDGPLPGVSDSDYFGIVNLDEQDQTIDRVTATFTHELSERVSLRNLTRWQRVAQYSQTSAPQGTFCLASGVQPITAANLATPAACPTGLRPGQYQPSGPRGLVRDQVNDLMYNQTDLKILSGEKGSLFNTLVVGASATWEDYALRTAQLLRNPGGALPNPVLPVIDLSSPDTTWTGPVNYVLTGVSDGQTRNLAVYAFDTLEIGKIELNAGMRYENVRNIFRADTVTTPATGAVYTRGAKQTSDENLFSYRFGAVYKPTQDLSLYTAYANSRTPSSATVRLGCGVIPAPGAADPCAVAPEKARSYEVGIKAALMGGRLQATAALFRNERSNYRVPSNDPTLPGSLQVLDGRSRVDGLALGVTGTITPQWTIFANYTYLKSKVVQGVSDFCRANPSATCLNSAANPDPAAGDDLIQTPEHSGSLYTSYRLPFGLEIGYGLTYQGSFALNQSVLANPRQFRSDDYLVHRAFLSYPIREGLTVQLNVQNFTDEDYYTGIRNNITAATGVVSGGWATPGEARSARLSLFYSF
ncbi:TonB-dependent receptor [Sphingobium algorifonticola]|uniref:TonB-dependent siderophore receptor n=1 Tax=Sphingobium algorifonticola TaxID=2008318 RepID=A0A437JCN6_9SPHN|nr:TonB-dependent siderophore receptor [Sphingobium algorifonticola]RVT43679.1 TonB-dependent siderophore receptor [Sphingobium algorifonticola]